MKYLIFILTIIPASLLGQKTFFGIGNNVSEPVVYDSLYQLILDEININGWTEPSETQKTAGNNLCLCLSQNNLWDEFDFLHVFIGVADEDQALGINWIDPGGTVTNLVSVGTLTWSTSTGFETDGNSYIDTNWQPADGINFTLNDASLGAHVDNLTVTTDYQTILGVEDYDASGGGPMCCDFTNVLGDFSTHIKIREVSSVDKTYFALNDNYFATYDNIASTALYPLWQTKRRESNSVVQFYAAHLLMESNSFAYPLALAAKDLTVHALNDQGVIKEYTESGTTIGMIFAGSYDITPLTFDTCWDNYLDALGL